MDRATIRKLKKEQTTLQLKKNYFTGKKEITWEQKQADKKR